jgi:hypothetical protein
MVKMAPSPTQPPVVQSSHDCCSRLCCHWYSATCYARCCISKEQDQAYDDKNDLDVFFKELSRANIIENPTGLGLDEEANSK